MEPVAIGLSLREPWLDGLLALEDRTALDLLEVMVDDLLDDGPWRRSVRRAAARWPIVAHGVDLGIGDAEGPDPSYLSQVNAALTLVGARWYSEHLCFVRGGGVDLGHFAPLDDDPETLEVLAENARRVRRLCKVPLLLENPADILGFGSAEPRAGRRHAERYARALSAANCGSLLDLTNLVYCAENDGFDVSDALDALPWERVVEVHLAGGHEALGLWIDSHKTLVDERALALLPEVARRAPQLRAVILERDDDLPELEALLAELGRVDQLLAGAGRR